MSSQKQVFSSNLLYIMHKKSITRTQLSDKTGIPYTTITNWIKCETYPRAKALNKLADYLQCEPYELISPKPSLESGDQSQQEDKGLKILNLTAKMRKLSTNNIDKIGEIVDKMLDVESSIKSAVSNDKSNN